MCVCVCVCVWCVCVCVCSRAHSISWQCVRATEEKACVCLHERHMRKKERKKGTKKEKVDQEKAKETESLNINLFLCFPIVDPAQCGLATCDALVTRRVWHLPPAQPWSEVQRANRALPAEAPALQVKNPGSHFNRLIWKSESCRVTFWGRKKSFDKEVASCISSCHKKAFKLSNCQTQSQHIFFSVTQCNKVKRFLKISPHFNVFLLQARRFSFFFLVGRGGCHCSSESRIEVWCFVLQTSGKPTNKNVHATGAKSVFFWGGIRA